MATQVPWYSGGFADWIQKDKTVLYTGSTYNLSLIAGHGNSVQMSHELNGKPGVARTGEDVSKVMSAKSKEWKVRMEDGKQIVLVLYACNTGSKEYFDSHFTQTTIRTAKTLAEKISETYPNITVIAPDGYVLAGVDSKTGKTKIIGVQQTTDKEHNNTMRGGFILFKNGKKIGKDVKAYDPKTHQKRIKPKEKL